MQSWQKYGELSRFKEKVLREVHPLSVSTTINSSSLESPLLPTKGKTVMRVLLIHRPLSTSSAILSKQARSFSNADEIDLFLSSFFRNQTSHSGNSIVEFYSLQLESLPFEEQVALIHQMDVLIGFHGAGVMHMFHLNPPLLLDPASQRSSSSSFACCSVIEVFPQSVGCTQKNAMDVCQIADRKGHGNIARLLGYRYQPVYVSYPLFFPSLIIVFCE
jgi:hypothetical protein